MATPENCKAINGKKRRSYKLHDGTMSDPFIVYEFYSRTFTPLTSVVLEADDDQGMINEILKDKKLMFKASNLSEESQLKFVDNDLLKQLEDDQGEDEI